MPPRVLNRRTHGIPPGAIYVGRPTKWGNPHPVGRLCPRCRIIHTQGEAVKAFEEDLTPTMKRVARRELRGHDLVCWCAPKPCHAYIWRDIANA